MKLQLALIFLVFGGGARVNSQVIAVSHRLEISVPIKGTVTLEDQAKLTSPLTGRVETMVVQERTWIKAGKPLAYLADTKTAALLDYRGMTPKDVLLKQWKSVYYLSPVVCKQDCFVIRRFALEGTHIRPGDPLFQVAYRIALVGQVSPAYLSWIENGQELTYWPVSNPLKKRMALVQNYVVQKSTVAGGVFTSYIQMDHYPDALQWEGKIVPTPQESNALVVPTTALVYYQGKVFLPLEVSIGLATPDLTEITAAGPLQGDNPILVLNDAQLKKAFQYDPLKYPSKKPLPISCPQIASQQQHQQKAPKKIKKLKPKGPSLWERIKNVNSLPSPEQERKSDAEDDYGN